MADVFVSYASEDRAVAQRLVQALERQRWAVWWDSSLDLGVDFRPRISSELSQARCVIVIWSRHSVESRWVRDEADNAAKRSVLVPLRIDDAPIPLGFGELQTGDLTGWNGDGSDLRFLKLAQRVRALIGGTAPPPLKPLPPWWTHPAILAGLAVGLLADVGAIVSYLITPPVIRFTASPTTAAAGDSVRLEWHVRKARSLIVQPVPGEQLALEDSRLVTPPIEAGDFEYRLFAEGWSGLGRRAEASVVVHVLNQREPVAEAASFAAEWRRGWTERDQSRLRAFINEPFYCFGEWFPNANALFSSLRPRDPKWAVIWLEPGDGTRGLAIWLLDRFRAEPFAVGTEHLLAELKALPEDLVVEFLRPPGRPTGPPGPQITCALISKSSGRWLVKGLFALRSGN